MMIIGSGIIGCEFATIFSNFGQTEVHLLDRTHRVIPFEDDDVSDFVSKNLEKNGVIIHRTANLRAVRKKSNYLEIVLDYEDGHSSVVEGRYYTRLHRPGSKYCRSFARKCGY